MRYSVLQRHYSRLDVRPKEDQRPCGHNSGGLAVSFPPGLPWRFWRSSSLESLPLLLSFTSRRPQARLDVLPEVAESPPQLPVLWPGPVSLSLACVRRLAWTQQEGCKRWGCSPLVAYGEASAPCGNPVGWRSSSALLSLPTTFPFGAKSQARGPDFDSSSATCTRLKHFGAF